MSRTAIITGIRGQDGSYLAELLLGRGYTVHGTSRGTASCHTKSNDRRYPSGSVQMHATDPLCQESWNRLICMIKPDEIYHFAADSYVPNGWEDPHVNLDINAGMTLRLLEAIRSFSPDTRMLNACSREVFGHGARGMFDEHTPMNPVSPYGINKAYSRWLVNAYRQRYDLFAASAVLFNHESPRRPPAFVTRKISVAAARIKSGLQPNMELGSLSALRDWGFAGDYVYGMYRMLQTDVPEDFVFGTGRLHSIEQFVSTAFQRVGLEWTQYVKCSPSLVRSDDTFGAAANTAKAQQLLGWSPSVDFCGLVHMMVDADMDALQHQDRRRIA